MADADAAEETARALVALPAEWSVLHHVSWPRRSGAAVDHVVVGPGGVFVIESSQARRSTATACVAAADALATGASLDRRMVHAVLCHAGDQPEVDVRDVVVCSPAEIVPLLLTLDRVLGPDELGSARAFVASAMAPVAAASAPRDRRAGSTGRLGLVLLVAAAVVSALPWAAAKVEDTRTGDPPPTPAIGEVLWVAGTTTRPPLELTAEELVDGGRRYVVQLTVRNDGDRAFDMDSLGSGLELDNLQQAVIVPHTEVELAGVRLEPGRERIVTYRFAVPPDRSAAYFATTVDDRRADRARWQIE